MAKRVSTPKRQPLPGVDDSAITEIEHLADELLDARENAAAKREEASAEEKHAEEALRECMHEHGKEVYTRNLEDGTQLEVKLRSGAETVLCRKRKARAPQG